MALYVVNSRNTLQQRKGILGEVNDNQAVGIVPYVGIGFRHKVEARRYGFSHMSPKVGTLCRPLCHYSCSPVYPQEALLQRSRS